MEFTQLDPTVLAEIQAARTSGSYKQALTEFAASDVSATDVSGAFPGKKVTTIAAGLKNAQRKDDAFSGIKVYNVGDVVALVKS